MIRALFLSLLLLAGAALAVQPDEMLADPALEARARAISREVRCPVCQGAFEADPERYMPSQG